MILGPPVTIAIDFYINEHLVNNYEDINGTDLRNEANKRQARNPKQTADYVPIQMDPRGSLDDADALRAGEPCLTIEQVDPNE